MINVNVNLKLNSSRKKKLLSKYGFFPTWIFLILFVIVGIFPISFFRKIGVFPALLFSKCDLSTVLSTKLSTSSRIPYPTRPGDH